MKQIIVALIAAFAIAQLYGCSAFGFAVGSDIDKKVQEYQDPKLLEPGQQIEVIPKSGEILVGKLSSVRRLEAEEYKGFIKKAQQESGDSIWIPDVGERIKLDVNLSGVLKTQEVIFLGFDKDRVWVVTMDEQQGTSFVEILNFYMVRHVSTPAMSLTSEQIVRLEREGMLPSLSAVVIERKGEAIAIPVSMISRLRSLSTKGYAKWLGLAVGLAIDAYLIVKIGGGLPIGPSIDLSGLNF